MSGGVHGRKRVLYFALTPAALRAYLAESRETRR